MNCCLYLLRSLKSYDHWLDWYWQIQDIIISKAQFWVAGTHMWPGMAPPRVEGRDWTLIYSGVTCCERQKNGVGFFSTSSVQKPGLEFSMKKQSRLLGRPVCCLKPDSRQVRHRLGQMAECWPSWRPWEKYYLQLFFSSHFHLYRFENNDILKERKLLLF